MYTASFQCPFSNVERQIVPEGKLDRHEVMSLDPRCQGVSWRVPPVSSLIPRSTTSSTWELIRAVVPDQWIAKVKPHGSNGHEIGTSSSVVCR
jgi:hypothetical protein